MEKKEQDKRVQELLGELFGLLGENEMPRAATILCLKACAKSGVDSFEMEIEYPPFEGVRNMKTRLSFTCECEPEEKEKGGES